MHYMCVYVPWYIIHYVCVRDIVCHKLSVYVCMHAMVLCVSVCHGAYVEARGSGFLMWDSPLYVVNMFFVCLFVCFSID